MSKTPKEVAQEIEAIKDSHGTEAFVLGHLVIEDYNLSQGHIDYQLSCFDQTLADHAEFDREAADEVRGFLQYLATYDDDFLGRVQDILIDRE